MKIDCLTPRPAKQLHVHYARGSVRHCEVERDHTMPRRRADRLLDATLCGGTARRHVVVRRAEKSRDSTSCGRTM